MIDFYKKQVLVLGLGRSGAAACRLLKVKGAAVVGWDQKEEEDLSREALSLREEGVSLKLGGQPKDLVGATDILVVSPGLPLSLPVFKEARERGIPIISEIELAYQFMGDHPLVAVTGTNGKTTVTTLIGAILKKAGCQVEVAGNIGIPLSKIITRLRPETIVVAEISSFQLETILDFRPKISIILNLSPDHLDRHPTEDDYLRAKARIFLNQGEDDFCILNKDDPLVCSLKEEPKAKIIFFSKEEMEEGIFLKEKKIVRRLSNREEEIFDIREIGIPGHHNLENVLAACGALMLLGIEKEAIRQTLREFKGLKHRLELVGEQKGVRFVNDSKATNVDATLRALEAIDSPIALIAGGQDKGSSLSPLKKVIREKVEALILMGQAKERFARELT
ncbi:UDP-N-acetylmuramoyl-L-alanine--D-glutamate ligase, partial [bacterium]|nr:UDP-N-acetylmuramoyl-L-alanine--D-glutamate ligase [bacterium]